MTLHIIPCQSHTPGKCKDKWHLRAVINNYVDTRSPYKEGVHSTRWPRPLPRATTRRLSMSDDASATPAQWVPPFRVHQWSLQPAVCRKTKRKTMIEN